MDKRVKMIHVLLHSHNQRNHRPPHLYKRPSAIAVEMFTIVVILEHNEKHKPVTIIVFSRAKVIFTD